MSGPFAGVAWSGVRMIGSCAFAADAGSKATKARTVSINFLMFNSATRLALTTAAIWADCETRYEMPDAMKRRSVVKAVTWRIVGTADTFVLSWLITKEPVTAGAIASLEVITKTFLYYFHERGWNRVKWGRG